MKKIYLTLVLCFFMACCLPAQENAIEVGHAAPPITITNWLHNVPDDVNIEGKFIILEFWATWCKPCIKSIPHINELQASAKDRDDVIFISITDEDPERAQTAIDRYDFQTVVATDVSRNTKRFFGVKAIPRTILIDNQGIIQWIGHPTLLKKRQLKLFLNGKLVPAEEHANRVEYGERAEKFSKSLREKQDHFEISEVQAYTNVKGLFTNNGTYYIGITPEALIANLMDVNLLEVEVPDSFKEKHYEVVYTNKNENLSEEARDRKLLNKVLQEF
ncbi:MAG: TlpA disulfide reductase family protein, partial [Bacteroidota bacterium]